MNKKYNYKISIIVPIYNAEKYLNDCLKSIACQDYDNFEVLMINDGSTDKSLEICMNYVNKDSRFIIINQKNAGVSKSRNNGILHSTGDYIMFVDADDYVDSYLLSNVIQHIDDYDILAFGYSQLFLRKKYNIVDNNNDNTFFYDKIFNSNIIGGFVWNKVFKKSIIINNNVFFDNNIHYCEDLLFVYNYLLHCKSFQYIPKVLYYYRMRRSSVSFSFTTKKNVSILNAYEYLISNIKDSNNTIILKYNYLVFYYKLKNIINENMIKYDTSIIESELDILNSLGFKYKIKLFLLKHLKPLYTFFVYIKNSFKGLYD